MPSPDSSPLIISQASSEGCRHPSLQLYLSGRRNLGGSTSDMAITHDDLFIRRRRGITDISGKLSLFLVILSIICGVSAFVLSLAAESSRSEAAWFIRSSPDGGRINECVYSGSGRTPLACALAAFLLLALAMFAEHAYMLVAVTNPDSPTLMSWAASADPSEASSSYKSLSWHACFLFLATWICFATAEVLLMIGIGVESGHLTQWRSMRSSCVVIRPGLFAAAGVLSLLTVFLGVGLYLTAMKTQLLHRDEEGSRDEARGAHRQHWVTPSAPQEPPVMGAQQSQPHLEGQYLSKTPTSV